MIGQSRPGSVYPGVVSGPIHCAKGQARRATLAMGWTDGWTGRPAPWLSLLAVFLLRTAPSRIPTQQETRGKLRTSSPRGIIVPRETGPEAVSRACMGHVVEGEGSGRTGKPGVAIPWSSPHQLPRGPDKQDDANREHCAFRSVHLQMGGRGGGERVGPMLGMGPVGAVVGHWCG